MTSHATRLVHIHVQLRIMSGKAFITIFNFQYVSYGSQFAMKIVLKTILTQKQKKNVLKQILNKNECEMNWSSL